jgi:hypothetical protein
MTLLVQTAAVTTFSPHYVVDIHVIQVLQLCVRCVAFEVPIVLSSVGETINATDIGPALAYEDELRS